MEIKVGEIIKAKREEKNYSLVEFSRLAGISAGYLSQLENGRKKNPNLEIVLRIIGELGIDINDLLGVKSSNESANVKMPSLLKLILAKDRNYKVLEDKDILKKVCDIIDRMLESKYHIEDKDLYGMFLEDVYIHIDTALKRYMAFQVIK
ncbi:MAG: helix-turn-helix domain-containing protein [Acetivibrionales bacterium]|jgi:transcriptional regulator with XRE-family HTH domain